ncbi:hypothetical protein OIU85_025182 [Salix viminalis]|uniref:non-specific serine/threonine protein kinase n=1 Tax=Salix viminalis TaxID=40686 RepID=A0A9Q0U2D7_SALVM|nr:hypothetical protein OIU85_025182 [Salix viminalis]
MASDLKNSLTKEYVGMELWVIIVVCLGLVCVFVLVVSLWLSFRKKSKRANTMLPVSYIPKVSEEIKEIGVDQNSANNDDFLSLQDKFYDKEAEKVFIQLENGDDSSQSASSNHVEKVGVGSQSGEEGGTKVAPVHRPSSHLLATPSPLSGLPEFSQLGWGHWFTLRDLQVATNQFSKDYIIGDGGYGVVYQGHLINGTPVAVKKLLNNPGQADKDFRVEVEAIGHVRHKNLVRLLGYCMEGTQRMLVYEYVNNGNLEQWLHGGMRQHGYLTWEARMKILLGTAKAHDSGGVNYKLYPFHHVNLVEWLKMMVAGRRSEEVVDPMIETRPATSALKRALLTALRCVDPDAEKRPKMSQVVRMLESEEYPIPRQDRRRWRSHAGEGETQNSDTDRSDNPGSKSDGRRNNKA